jgi:D-alanine-D-alanine ligase
LKKQGYDYKKYIMTRDVKALMEALNPKPDVVFNILHGKWGEDGHIQAILDIENIKYTHSGMLASTIAMDKPLSKMLCKQAGVPCAEDVLMHIEDVKKRHPMPPPYVVKPADEGSTVGVYIVHEGEAPLGDQITEWPYNPMAMVERYIPGVELTAGVMGDRTLDVLEATTTMEFFTYEAKYAQGGSEHILPARIPVDVREKIMDYALKAHNALGCRGITRSDFRYNPANGDICYLETNTQPGFTYTSMFPDIAEYVGIPFDDLVHWMIEDALCRD